MAATMFTPEVRTTLIDAFTAGLSVRDAARVGGIAEKTLKRWITRGRREEEGPFADFVARIEDAREYARNRPEPADADELAVLVSEAARAGSVPAMKLRWEMLAAGTVNDEPTPGIGSLDELAERRLARAA